MQAGSSQRWLEGQQPLHIRIEITDAMELQLSHWARGAIQLDPMESRFHTGATRKQQAISGLHVTRQNHAGPGVLPRQRLARRRAAADGAAVPHELFGSVGRPPGGGAVSQEEEEEREAWRKQVRGGGAIQGRRGCRARRFVAGNSRVVLQDGLGRVASADA